MKNTAFISKNGVFKPLFQTLINTLYQFFTIDRIPIMAILPFFSGARRLNLGKAQNRPSLGLGDQVPKWH